MMDEHQNRLTTVREFLTALLYAAEKRGLTHKQRNYALGHVIDMIVTWQMMDTDHADQLTEVSEDEIPF